MKELKGLAHNTGIQFNLFICNLIIYNNFDKIQIVIF